MNRPSVIFHLPSLAKSEAVFASSQAILLSIDRGGDHFFKITICDLKERSRPIPQVCALRITEQGVAMLSAVLRSQTAVRVSIQIMQAFVDMRHPLNANALTLSRIDTVEQGAKEGATRLGLDITP